MAPTKIFLFFVLISAVAICHANPIQERSADPEAGLKAALIAKLKEALKHKLAGRSAGLPPGIVGRFRARLQSMMSGGKRSADPDPHLGDVITDAVNKLMNMTGKRSADPDPHLGDVITDAVNALMNMTGKRSADPKRLTPPQAKALKALILRKIKQKG